MGILPTCAVVYIRAVDLDSLTALSRALLSRTSPAARRSRGRVVEHKGFPMHINSFVWHDDGGRVAEASLVSCLVRWGVHDGGTAQCSQSLTQALMSDWFLVLLGA
jgi:hypothetical protein